MLVLAYLRKSSQTFYLVNYLVTLLLNQRNFSYTITLYVITEMKKETLIEISPEKPWYKRHLIGIIGFLFLISYIFYTIYKKGSYENIYYDSKFECEIIDVFQEKSSLYILHSNSKDRIKIQNNMNTSYPDLGLHLSDILKKGDIIYKRTKSDTLHLIKNKIDYSFIIENLSVKYKRVRKNTGLDGNVNDILVLNDSIYILLNKYDSRFLISNYKNKNHQELYETIENGDYIRKKSTSDTISIHKNDSTYYFHISGID